MVDSEDVRAALAALASGEAESADGFGEIELARTPNQGDAPERPRPESGPNDYRAIIERASAAVEDLDAAAAFAEEVGVDALDAAVRQAEREVSALAGDGRAARAAFRRYRHAARDGESE
ncbi:hypothetical protein [Haloarcula salina]|uniref:Uncharacterized protein n=1 Tax=Haloarcula salina TaxID=1429914 RepID=A0AA41KI99_9EURY|nr:hypothetical protein [Haloarcula salina]MBV0901478.1 hypothetical protein [Haloarcula salina]